MTDGNASVFVVDGCRRNDPVPLSDLRSGDWATLHRTDLHCDECELLNAMGLSHECELRVCQRGEPCIVQINSTRLGLSSKLAGRIFVRPRVTPR